MYRLQEHMHHRHIGRVLQPLISRTYFLMRRPLFRKLTLDYVLRQIEVLKQSIVEYEQKYGMAFSQYEQYLHERYRLLESPTLSDTQRQRLGQSVMIEEDDWRQLQSVPGNVGKLAWFAARG